jgi:hypothetical protein
MSDKSQGPNPACAFEALEGRELFAVTVTFVAPDTLRFTGDAQADTAVIYDNGAGTLYGSRNEFFGLSVPFGPYPNIRKVEINMGANNDRVRYTFTGDVPSGGTRYVSALMGDGLDNFRLEMGADVDLMAGSYVNVRVNGGNGDDVLTTRYHGEVDGVLSMTLDGGAGWDRVVTDNHADAGSTGLIHTTLFAESVAVIP